MRASRSPSTPHVPATNVMRRWPSRGNRTFNPRSRGLLQDHRAFSSVDTCATKASMSSKGARSDGICARRPGEPRLEEPNSFTYDDFTICQNRAMKYASVRLTFEE